MLQYCDQDSVRLSRFHVLVAALSYPVLLLDMKKQFLRVYLVQEETFVWKEVEIKFLQTRFLFLNADK